MKYAILLLLFWGAHLHAGHARYQVEVHHWGTINQVQVKAEGTGKLDPDSGKMLLTWTVNAPAGMMDTRFLTAPGAGIVFAGLSASQEQGVNLFNLTAGNYAISLKAAHMTTEVMITTDHQSRRIGINIVSQGTWREPLQGAVAPQLTVIDPNGEIPGAGKLHYLIETQPGSFEMVSFEVRYHFPEGLQLDMPLFLEGSMQTLSAIGSSMRVQYGGLASYQPLFACRDEIIEVVRPEACKDHCPGEVGDIIWPAYVCNQELTCYDMVRGAVCVWLPEERAYSRDPKHQCTVSTKTLGCTTDWF